MLSEVAWPACTILPTKRGNALMMRVLRGQISSLHEPGTARTPDKCKDAAGIVGDHSRNSLHTLLALMKSLQRNSSIGHSGVLLQPAASGFASNQGQGTRYDRPHANPMADALAMRRRLQQGRCEY